MAFTCKRTTASNKMKAAVPGAKAAGSAFNLQDNQDGTVTVFGVDAAGAQVDISSVATLTVKSSDDTVYKVDTPTGMTYAEHGVKPGSATATIVATWNDGSMGPFSIDDPVTVSGGPAVGLTVVHGTPVPRP